jgi:hypothetical protein
MPIRDDLYQKMIADREAAERGARRADLFRWLAVLAVCLLWQVVGGVVVVLAFHLHMDRDTATQLMWGGLGIAAAGTVLTVALGAPKQGREE